MSCQLLLSLVAHSMTLLHRGQTFTQLPFKITQYRAYYACVAICIGVHVFVMGVRAWLRVGGVQRYEDADAWVWVAMVLSPLAEIATGIRVNVSDDQSYKRYLQYLRLEFDTRLGMYSPR